jgi:hypothetical protein
MAASTDLTKLVTPAWLKPWSDMMAGASCLTLSKKATSFGLVGLLGKAFLWDWYQVSLKRN